jgi:hypothetical protein
MPTVIPVDDRTPVANLDRVGLDFLAGLAGRGRNACTMALAPARTALRVMARSER